MKGKQCISYHLKGCHTNNIAFHSFIIFILEIIGYRSIIHTMINENSFKRILEAPIVLSRGFICSYFQMKRQRHATLESQ